MIETKPIPARAFVRNLNILLKFARMYGFDHARTAEQFDATWHDLQASLPAEGAGLLLGATGSQLLIDSSPIETTTPEKNFAQLLSGAGLASIQFSPHVTREDLAQLVRAFPAGRDTTTVEQWKEALLGTGIRANEIRFIAEDAATADTKVAAQLIARTLGADADRLRNWLNDPQKLIQLMAAAEASHADAARAEPGEPAGAAPSLASSGALKEDELVGLLKMFCRIGQAGEMTGGAQGPGIFQEQLAKLPENAQLTLRQALTNLASQAPPSNQPEEPVLLRLAEQMAIQFALDRYERGEVRVDAVRQMLDRMGREIESLRKIMSAHEEKMARAGLKAEPHAEILDRQFWAAVPESGKRSVLLSPEAWCIPPRNVRQYVEQLLARGEKDTAKQILSTYAHCIRSEEAEARRRVALSLTELSDLYGRGEESVLSEAIREAGAQLMLEREAELQTRISEAFVRLSQEAIRYRCYAAVQQAMASLDGIENQRPTFAQSLRPRIGIEGRLAEFLDEALRTEQIPAGLGDILRLLPRPVASLLLGRFNRCGVRGDGERLVQLAKSLGAEAVSQLRELLRAGPDAEAPETVGLLSRLDPAAVEQFLPDRIRMWPRASQDRVIRQIAAAGSPEGCRVLLALLGYLDPLLMPLALDDISMCGDATAVPRLLQIAQGELPERATVYVRLKAIEALGRLRAQEAVAALRQIVEAKQMWRWANHSELRIAAAQALEKIDPDGARQRLPATGLSAEDLSFPPLDPMPGSRWMRQRRYARLRLARPVTATTENQRLEIKLLNLGGGVALCERHLTPGTLLTLKLNPGLRPLRMQAIVRSARAQTVGFEVADMDLEERARLRKLLLELAVPGPTSAAPKESSAEAPVPADKKT
jgi:hypothetical protein